MKNNKGYNLIILFCLCFLAVANVNAQSDWQAPAEENEKLSPFLFDDDMVLEGRVAYENSCTSCHGTPGQDDFTPMSPPPGDPGAEAFQAQSDGSIFYKIKMGRGTMPKFEDAFADDELWNIVAYIRSFNEDYKQELPNMEGVVIPEYAMRLSFDENVDKLVVKIFAEEVPQPEVSVSAYVMGTFGKHLLGKAQTNELGIAYVDVDPTLPGDEEGKINVMVKATKGFARAKLQQDLAMAKPTERHSAIEGRHIWSTDRMAPIWLKITFFVSVFGVWFALLFIVFGLRNIKKAREEA
ncbi:c-type cytochrome [Marinifilum flexuosum]|uniref:Mono/diheme cytochrome c family protein n=1 Tax=Marinifilum flexuosum TaxID=1117708 RepID=A0A419X7E7_9BACT|nr:cytochrome c [Marinifilum flexuosum]RKE03490.1 mono/diheme cytochrome c family protein [Marinifilum flexuosum]